MDPVELKEIEELDHVSTEPIDRVSPRRRIGCTVAAHIVAQQPKGSAEFRNRSIPHVQVRGDRVRERKHRPVLGTIEPIRDPAAVDRGEKLVLAHLLSPFPANRSA